MKNYNFESFNNKQLYQTLSLSILNKSIKIPIFHPTVSWNNGKYTWEYNLLKIKKIKKEWTIEKSKNEENIRYLKQYNASGDLTWFSKQVITNATNDLITVKEYNMLNNAKLIGIVNYRLPNTTNIDDGVKLNQDLYLKTSKLGGKYGRGVFSNRNFEVGETIELAPYIEDINSNYKGVIRDYIFKKSINSDKSVVAFGYGSMYNHSDIPNASWKVNDNHVKISCIKPINKDEEIFLSYGSKYWSSRNLDKKS